jgi:hypothetical protein
LLAAFLSFNSLTFVQSPDPNFYIFVCFGQSNMEGVPGIEQQDGERTVSGFGGG